MKNSKQIDYEYLIEAFKTLYSDQYFHDSCTLSLMPGIDDSREIMELELRTAMGHDGRSLEIYCKNVMTFPDKNDDAVNPNGGAVMVIENRAAYLIGAAMIGYALNADDKDQL